MGRICCWSMSAVEWWYLVQVTDKRYRVERVNHTLVRASPRGEGAGRGRCPSPVARKGVNTLSVDLEEHGLITLG